MGELQAALPREYYLPGAAWDNEVDRIWRHGWVCAGRTADLGLDLAGRLAVVEVAGESLLVTCDGDGVLHGHANVCRHRGAQLCPHPPGAPPAPGPAATLRCEYHAWTYGLDGRLIRAPGTEDSDDLDPGSFGLHPVSVGTWGGFLFVRLTDGDRSLADEVGAISGRTAAYPLADLVSVHRTTCEVAANWKVIAEYHAEHHADHPDEDTADVGTDAGTDAGTGAGAGAGQGAGAGADASGRSWVLPNLLLSPCGANLAVFVLTPSSADRTRVTFDLLAPPGQVATPVDDLAAAWEVTNRRGQAFCESVQRGLSSSFHTGGWFTATDGAATAVRRWLLPRLEWRGGLGEHP